MMQWEGGPKLRDVNNKRPKNTKLNFVRAKYQIFGVNTKTGNESTNVYHETCNISNYLHLVAI